MLPGCGIAGNAIDENRNSDLTKGSCTQTAQQSAPWWRVNLHRKYTISTVALTNRGDCCAEGLDGAEIRIGNSLENDGKNNPLCATVSSIPAGQTEYFNCGSLLEGSYVTVSLPGEGTLSLCEVEVFGISEAEMIFRVLLLLSLLSVPGLTASTENLADGAQAVQSTTYDHLGAAQNAVDGDRNPDYLKSSCSHTNFDVNPWWRVELPDIYNVTSVTITNRGDCCKDRINGAQIRIGNSLENNGNNNKLVAVINTLGSGVTKTYQFRGTQGRYVNVFLPGENRILTLCEVEVFADRESSPKSFHPHENLAVGAQAVQSTTYDHLGAAQNAVDGDRNPDYLKNSCSHTHFDVNPWWRVELPDIYNVTSVTITNRKDCCGDRINGAQIRIGNSLENNGNNNKL
ncbi:hypothetical protein NFI96_006427 [Prochilodus magdalenae]|nr:hypothetical protein NFI96_006427 [Prochilodus magdalenae]